VPLTEVGAEDTVAAMVVVVVEVELVVVVVVDVVDVVDVVVSGGGAVVVVVVVVEEVVVVVELVVVVVELDVVVVEVVVVGGNVDVVDVVVVVVVLTTTGFIVVVIGGKVVEVVVVGGNVVEVVDVVVEGRLVGPKLASVSGPEFLTSLVEGSAKTTVSASLVTKSPWVGTNVASALYSGFLRSRDSIGGKPGFTSAGLSSGGSSIFVELKLVCSLAGLVVIFSLPSRATSRTCT